MERASYFIKDTALFGSFPTQDAVNTLEKMGVKYFIDLTVENERGTKKYKTKYNYIKFPITDHQVPANILEFSLFIIKLSNILYTLNDDEKIYIHCKGGHGRAGIVVSSLLCYIFEMSPKNALSYTSIYHSQRKQMRDKWRKIGSPQNKLQKNFVKFLCRFIYIEQDSRTVGFSLDSPYKIEIKDIGEFPTATAAYQMFKCPDNEEYILKQKNSPTAKFSIKLATEISIRPDWHKVKYDLLYKVQEAKFTKYSSLHSNLLKTGLSPLISSSKNNLLGKVLVNLRLNYYKNII